MNGNIAQWPEHFLWTVFFQHINVFDAIVLRQTSKRMHQLCNTVHIPKLAQQITHKYTRQNKEYQEVIQYLKKRKDSTDHRHLIHPILLDIFFSGVCLPFATSTFDTYNKHTTFDAIALMISDATLTHTTFGHLRCREKVTPLCAACINPEVPMCIIRLLLYLSDGNHHIVLNGNRIHILDDIEKCNSVSRERLHTLRELFETIQCHTFK